ncbi:putative E3 ubiquitin-protein ligase HECTD1 [Paratrimastix pyriformis]|uniref:E3 ubiquitin-protein ligase HECTD1 n=1 Tax=Paratrimastix pyriformis TaxID=342808 RepID=A0ABQ8UNF3_9EUKA|nr:putative E3 ubiquitin-protein ligase HECTD1 [Paratrimastix pyriformis]
MSYLGFLEKLAFLANGTKTPKIEASPCPLPPHQRALELKQKAIDFYTVGKSGAACGKLREAIELVRQSQDQNDRLLSAQLYSDLAQVYLALEKPDMALDVAQSALRIVPTYLKAAFRLGRAALELTFFEKAAVAFQYCRHLSPDNAIINEAQDLQEELAETKARLVQAQEELKALKHNSAGTPPTPSSLRVEHDCTTKNIVLAWNSVSNDDHLPVYYRVSMKLPDQPWEVIYTGTDRKCKGPLLASLPVGKDIQFAVCTLRALAESPLSDPPCIYRKGGVFFKYAHDLDENGLFYYLGTQGGTQPWRNPAAGGLVTVTRSAECFPPGGSPNDACGRSPCESHTLNAPGAWQCFDLGATRTITPTKYTLRHSNMERSVAERLQSWRLEGSPDGKTWRPLDEHTGEPLPAQPDATASYGVVPAKAFPARFIRLLMTGPSPCGLEHLCLSGFELYGFMQEVA